MPENPGPYVNTFIRRGRSWHLVESKIADRLITRCGRQMRERARGRKLEVRKIVPALEYCLQCSRRDRR